MLVNFILIFSAWNKVCVCVCVLVAELSGVPTFRLCLNRTKFLILSTKRRQQKGFTTKSVVSSLNYKPRFKLVAIMCTDIILNSPFLYFYNLTPYVMWHYHRLIQTFSLLLFYNWFFWLYFSTSGYRLPYHNVSWSIRNCGSAVLWIPFDSPLRIDSIWLIVTTNMAQMSNYSIMVRVTATFSSPQIGLNACRLQQNYSFVKILMNWFIFYNFLITRDVHHNDVHIRTIGFVQESHIYIIQCVIIIQHSCIPPFHILFYHVLTHCYYFSSYVIVTYVYI